MPEASQNFFWSPGGPGGTVFLKSAFLVFLVIFLQTWAEIDARSLPKIFLIPRGASFLVKNLEIEQFQLVSRKSKKLSLLYYFRTKKYVLGGLSLLKFRLCINKTAQRRKSDMVYLSFNSTSQPTLLIKIHFKSSK